MNSKPKNAVITFSNLDNLKAEIFFQTVNCQHIVDNYQKDLPKRGTKGQFHDLLFTDIRKALSGNVLTFVVNKRSNKYRTLSFYNGKYYDTFLYLQKRDDCPTLFAVIATIYQNTHKKDHDLFQNFEKRLAEKYPPGSRPKK